MKIQNSSLESVALRAAIAHYGPFVVLVLAIVGLSWVLDNYLGTVAFFLPLLIAAGLWLIKQGLRDKADHDAIERSLGVESPEPGQWTAVCGRARALQPDAETPFSDVLAFRYQVFDEERGARTAGERTSKHMTCRYDGFFLVPTGIETPAGTIRLSGFPDLIHLERRSLPAGVHERAHASAQLSPRLLPKFLARSLFLAHVRDRIEGYIRYGDEPESSEGTCKSWLLRPDEQVCVFGVWRDGALYPGSGRSRGLPVYAGTADEVRQRLKGDSSAFFVIGAIIIAGGLTWALWSTL
ncbi:MAG: hypothetical protein H6955_06440 [Chromatiaceae bacterium]|nr:hypothetical protein [Chromatiaceae bacterium]